LANVPLAAKNPNAPKVHHCPPGADLILTYCQSSTTDSAVATPTITPAPTASASADTGCDPSDTNCNYCNLALYELDICTSVIDPVNDFLGDCLCYEATSNNASVLWAPNYFDAAYSSCLPYASSSAKEYYSDVSSLQGLCSQWGNYGNASSMDENSYVLKAVATATGTAVGNGSVPTSTTGSESSGSKYGAGKRGVGVMVSLLLKSSGKCLKLTILCQGVVLGFAVVLAVV
jgi:hypothetical protein